MGLLRSIGAAGLGTTLLLAACAPKTNPETTRRKFPPVAVLIEQLQSDDISVRHQAAWDLAWLDDPSTDAAAAAALAELLTSEDRELRHAAAWRLSDSRPRDGDTKPRLLKSVAPEYPERAFQQKITGTVELTILVGEDGSVAQVGILKSIPRLDAAAIACVRQWRFDPAVREGKPIAVRAHVPVRFSIY